MIPLIDLHTHILPGIDDGAQNLKESVSMLISLKQQGVQTVVLTPHYLSREISLQEFLQKRQQAFEQIRSLPEAEGIQFVLASETYLGKELFQQPDISPLCINNRYLLLELPYATEFTSYTCDIIMKIMYQYGIHPILAHVERYPDLIQYPHILEKLLDEGVLTQINVSSLNSFWMRRRLFSMIKNGYIHFLGTDCHHPQKRPPEYRVWTDKLQKSLGEDTLEQLMQNATAIVSDNNKPL